MVIKLYDIFRSKLLTIAKRSVQKTLTMSYVQVLGCHPWLLAPQLFIVKDQTRILINAGDNTQRFGLEHRVRLSRLNHIILTRIASDTVGGLLGLLLTLELNSGTMPTTIPSTSNYTNNNNNCFASSIKPRVKGVWKQYNDPLVSEEVPNICVSYKRDTFIMTDNLKPSSHESSNPNKVSSLSIIHIWGPPPLFQYIERATSEFAGIRCLDIRIHEIQPLDNSLCNSGLTGISLAPEQIDNCNMIMYCVPLNSNFKKQRKSYSTLQANLNINPLLSNFTLLISLTFPQVPGHLDASKLQALNIPKGPWLRQLKNGESVTLKNGQTIHPEQLCEPPVSGCKIIFIDMTTTTNNNNQSSQEIVTNVSTITQMIDHCDTFRKSTVDTTIFDLTCLIDVKDEEWKQKLHDNVTLLNNNSVLKDLSFYPCYIPIHLLNTFYPFYSVACFRNILQLLLPNGFSSNRCCNEKTTEIYDDQNNTHLTLYPLTKYITEPVRQRGLDRKNVLKLGKPFYENTRLSRFETLTEDISTCKDCFTDAYSKIINHPCSIQFLGTGAAMPSKYRNVSCTVIKWDDKFHDVPQYIMLDCGEGTLSQMFEMSKTHTEFHNFLQGISIVVISHKHADHHLGLPLLLKTRAYYYPDLCEPSIIGPKEIGSWLSFWDTTIERIPHTFIDCGDYQNILFENKQSTIDINIKLAEVDHIQDPLTQSRIGCYGARIDIIPHNNKELATLEKKPITNVKEESGLVITKTRWPNPLLDDSYILPNQFDLKLEQTNNTSHVTSIVYSGDTRPCQNLIDIAKDCDVLIHEATFEDDCINEAREKHHSTISEAFNVGDQANTKFLILTHFSQRYPSIPSSEKLSSIAKRSCVAFDGLTVPLGILSAPDAAASYAKGFCYLEPILVGLRSADD